MSPDVPEIPPAASAKAGPTWWLTRFVILRWLGFVYLIAFLVAVNQLVPLVGAHGLTPAMLYTDRVAAHFGSKWSAFLQFPSVFWADVSDHSMLAVSWLGVALAAAVMLGYANAIVMFALWALYMSIVNIGQDWYSYGWEMQLLETGFLGIFLCPLLDGRPFPRRPPPTVVFWLFLWLIFRIMLGAGLIKLRGDSCWRDLTCLYYYYETQPIPNPFSRFCQFQPHWFQKFGVLWNFFVELAVPFFMIVPGVCRRLAGFFLFTFQLFLIFSGNLSFLNWLTIVPILACFDDALLSRLLPKFITEKARRAAAEAKPSLIQERIAIGLAVLIGLLSILPVANLISPSQIMNTSFNRLQLVNTYGAFGSVGRERLDIVFEGTDDPVPSESTKWKEYPNQRPAGLFDAPASLRGAVSIAAGLAIVVRRHVQLRGISLDAALRLETSAQRRADSQFARVQSVSAKTSPLHSRRALPLRIRRARKSRRSLVEAHAPGPVAPRSVRRRSPPALDSGRLRMGD